jgi:hypothetical protein
MKKSTLAAALLAGMVLAAMPAKADLVLSQFVFADLGGTGFGVAPRMLTLQNNVLETGGTVAGPGGTTIITGPDTTNQSNVFSLATLGWTSGAEVGIGLDTNEIGATEGLMFNSLVLTIYDNLGNPLGSFSGDEPVFISQALLALQQGNGNSVFNIGLDAAQQAQFDALIAGRNLSQTFEGLSASFGCIVVSDGCGPSTNGADSFLGFRQSAVPGPIVGAGIPGLLVALGGMFGLNNFRRRRRQMA